MYGSGLGVLPNRSVFMSIILVGYGLTVLELRMIGVWETIVPWLLPRGEPTLWALNKEWVGLWLTDALLEKLFILLFETGLIPPEDSTWVYFISFWYWYPLGMFSIFFIELVLLVWFWGEPIEIISLFVLNMKPLPLISLENVFYWLGWELSPACSLLCYYY